MSSFREKKPDNNYHEFVPTLIGIERDGTLTYWGTCFVVLNFMVVIARHVLDQFVAREPGGPTYEQLANGQPITTEMWVIQDIRRNGKFRHYNVWKPITISQKPDTDLAVMTLGAYSDDAVGYNDWKSCPLQLSPPSIGDRVYGFGRHDVNFRGSSWAEDGRADNIKINARDSVAEGIVTSVYPRGRDKTLCPFPCFETNMRVESGMSGGPVINERSELVGLVTTGYDLGDPSADAISYVSLLWPMLTILVDFDVFSYSPIRGKRPLIEIVHAGVLKARGLEHFEEAWHEDGRMTLRFVGP